jgi:hypothetical protein
MKNKIFRRECQENVKSGKFNLIIYLLISEKLVNDHHYSIPVAEHFGSDLGIVE